MYNDLSYLFISFALPTLIRVYRIDHSLPQKFFSTPTKLDFKPFKAVFETPLEEFRLGIIVISDLTERKDIVAAPFASIVVGANEANSCAVRRA